MTCPGTLTGVTTCRVAHPPKIKKKNNNQLLFIKNRGFFNLMKIKHLKSFIQRSPLRCAQRIEPSPILVYLFKAHLPKPETLLP
jgi:hypothetical protein